MNKEEFIQACREGGGRLDRAFRAMYASYARTLLREAWLVLRNKDACYDLLQETFDKVWSNCKQFRGESELLTWCKTVLRRTAIDHLRKIKPEVPLQDDEGQVLPEAEQALQRDATDSATRPEEMLAGQQSDALFRECALRFERDHPQAALLIRWIVEDGLKPSDIATLLQRSPGAAREYVSQCRKKARHYFAEWYQLVGHGDAKPSPLGKDI